MSKLNIKRTVENIPAITTVYSPIFEVVINAIQATELPWYWTQTRLAIIKKN